MGYSPRGRKESTTTERLNNSNNPEPGAGENHEGSELPALPLARGLDMGPRATECPRGAAGAARGQWGG